MNKALRRQKRRSNQHRVKPSSSPACWTLPLSLLLGVAACNDSSGYVEPGPRPQIVAVAGPRDGVIACDPNVVGGSCPLPIDVTFRLAENHFVTKAIVRFQGDGSDDGVDRNYVVENAVGKGEAVDVRLQVNARIPETILRKGALFTYTFRLLTGAGEESRVSTLTISVQ
jgi:hypothetical protein